MKISFLNYTKSKKNNNNVLLCTLKYNLAKQLNSVSIMIFYLIKYEFLFMRKHAKIKKNSKYKIF